MHFTFQESKIWEAGNPVDPNGKTYRIKARSLARAKLKLPKTSSVGRSWVLVKEEGR